jgi:hypothetical protein
MEVVMKEGAHALGIMGIVMRKGVERCISGNGAALRQSHACAKNLQRNTELSKH